MPELPEVETVRRGLAAVLEGKRIAHVELRRPNLRQAFPPDFARRLTGRKVERLGRRAKYILVHCEGGPILIIHLGMSGHFSIVGPGVNREPPGRHDHVVIGIADGPTLVFTDPRRFGLMTLAEPGELAAHPLLHHLGPEPLDPGFDGAALSRALAGRASPIKVALLDQKLVAGVGNIYACEALFRARISPRRKARTVAGARARRLVGALRAVLREAIAAGGSSLRDHARVDGELGYFQHAFAVYGRTGQPCPARDCGGGIKRIIQAGRSTFYCSRCQR